MLLELLNNYKKTYLNKKEQIQEQQRLNQKIQYCIDSLNNKNMFLNLDINEFLKVLTIAKYLMYPLDGVETTLIYIKRNNLFDDINCKQFLNNLKQSLEYEKTGLEKTTDLDYSILEIENILQSIENQGFLDVSFLLKLIKNSNLTKEEIYTLMLEINTHNLQVINNLKEKNVSLEQKQEANQPSNVKLNMLELLAKYDYQLEFTSIEKEILEKVNLAELEEKLVFLANNFQFSFLKQEENKKLLVVLLGLAPLSNIKSIYKLTKEEKIPLDSILPTFYLNIDFKIDFLNDEFYQSLTGAYENFFAVMDNFSNSMKPSKLISEFSVVCMTDYDKLISNIDILKEYEIPLSTFSIKCLTIDNLREKIDKFIEAGLYEYIKNVPAILLNEDEAFFHRIYFANTNNIPIKRRFLYKDITDVNGLDINRDNYQEKVRVYKPQHLTADFYQDLLSQDDNALDLRNNLYINLLSEYKIDEYMYNINGILISRHKVIRLYENYVSNMKKMSGYSNEIDKTYLIRGIIFAVISDVILNYEDSKKVILELLKVYSDYFDLTKEQINTLGINFELLDNEKESLFNKLTKNEGY